MGKRELIFEEGVSLVLNGLIAPVALALIWPMQRLIRFRDQVLAWAETCGEAH